MLAVKPNNTDYKHVILNDKKEPSIAGTSTRVTEIVASYLAYGWSAEEICLQYPYLTLGQVYSALAYYWDHSTEIEAALQDELNLVEQMRGQLKGPPHLQRLKAMKLRAAA